MESSMKKTVLERRLRLIQLSMRRREMIRKTIMEKQREIKQHIRRRMYILNNMKKRIHTIPPNTPSRPSSTLRPAEIQSEWWETMVMKEFKPQDWLNTFHLSKDTFDQLYNKLRLLKDVPRFPISLEKCLAGVLLRLATNLDYQSIGELLGTSSTTILKYTGELCNILVRTLKPLYIQQPSEQELEETAEVFKTSWGFPHCVGIIDSLHIAVKSKNMTSEGWNSKGWPSAVLQGVVNGQGHFWDVRVGVPGSTDDCTLLQGSALWTSAREKGLMPQTPQKILDQPLGYVLLGDAGFPLQSWLLKCYPGSQLTPQQCVFNARLKHAQTPIERTFLHLKARWQCLNRITSHATLIPVMIQACCILHNMCEMNSDPIMEKWLEETNRGLPQPCDIAPARLDDSDGEAVRSLLCDYFHHLPESLTQEPLDTVALGPMTLSECAQAVNILTTLE